MTPREVLDRRLRRLAEDVRFSHYIICPHCFAPIIVSPTEVAAPPRHFGCEECGALIASNSVGVLRYEPPAAG